MILQLNQRKNEIFKTSPSWAEALGERIGEAIGRGIKNSNAIAPAIQQGVETGATNATNSSSHPTRMDRRRALTAARTTRAIRAATLGGTALQMAGLGISYNTMGGYWASNGL